MAGVAGLAGLLLDGTRWTVTFPALALLIVAWLAQAIHAHQSAIRGGAAPGGEMQVAWTLPLILVVVTAFWLLGGNQATPAATLQEYVSSWQAGRVESAERLFVERIGAERLAAEWQAHRAYLARRVAETAELYGTASGLDPADPFSGLRLLELEEQRNAERTLVAVDIVRRQRVETTLFGLIPTATQETVLVERAGYIRLRAVPVQLPDWLPAGRPAPAVWQIEEIVLPAS